MSNRDVTAVISSMLENLSQVSVRKKHNGASFLVGKKVFAYTRGDDLIMKLPKEKIEELVDKRNASALVMGKRVMKEWVIMQHREPTGYKKDLALLKEAMRFVSSVE